MVYVTGGSKGNPRRESNPWIEDTLEKEIKRLTEEKEHLEEISKDTMENIDKNKKSKRYGSKASLIREDTFFKLLGELKNRHYNISIRIKKLEWDYCNIVKIIDKKCKYCDCDKINFIRFPINYVHYAKEECSRCGRWQKFIPPPT